MNWYDQNADTLEPKDVMPLLKRIHFIHKEGSLSLSGKTILSDLNLAMVVSPDTSAD